MAGMIKVYGKAGDVLTVDPVDARELTKNGEYSTTPPEPDAGLAEAMKAAEALTAKPGAKK